LISPTEAGFKKETVVAQCFLCAEEKERQILEQTVTLTILAFQQNVFQLSKK